ncbi:MAG: flavin reductase family protein [Acidovorax sp.]|jgi:flavin reductase (DIM6/NTAB) family NADH-FMN oxidoreductase RutF|nr:flavin reductase family protein [Acidovorax sp.]
MDWRADQLSERECYKLLVNTVLPRPIALVTTLGDDGVANTAPFSFFNVMASDPAIVALGLEGDSQSSDGLKDTTRNILARGEFVVNLVHKPLVDAMSICGVPFPTGEAEHAHAVLTTIPSVQIATPRIAQSRVQFECRLHTTLTIGPARHVVIGEILHLHIDDALLTPSGHIDVDAFQPVGRIHGSDWYVDLGSRFQSTKYTLADWQSR